MYIIVLISAKKHRLWYLLELPHWDGSKEYPQSMFWAEIWKIPEFLSENFQFFVVKFSIYLNRHVFIMEWQWCSCFSHSSISCHHILIRNIKEWLWTMDEWEGVHKQSCASLGGSVGCAVRLETRRTRVQPPPRSATFFRGDWSWNIFYGRSHQ